MKTMNVLRVQLDLARIVGRDRANNRFLYGQAYPNGYGEMIAYPICNVELSPFYPIL